MGTEFKLRIPFTLPKSDKDVVERALIEELQHNVKRITGNASMIKAESYEEPF